MLLLHEGDAKSFVWLAGPGPASWKRLMQKETKLQLERVMREILDTCVSMDDGFDFDGSRDWEGRHTPMYAWL